MGHCLAHPVLLACWQWASVGLFVLCLLTGLFGTQGPTQNLAPTLVWVIWWVGLAYVSALLGNLWALINPWKVLFEWAESLYRRARPEDELARRWTYPKTLGVWPGVVLFLVFTWIELVFEGSAVPANLAGLALIYSGLTWTGMFLFGKDVWLRYGEAFSLVFGLLARFAPTEVRVVNPHVCQACRLDCGDRHGACIDCYACFERAEVAQREWNLRPYAAGLVQQMTASVADMVFILLLLATVTFDGFMATSLWVDIENALQALLPDVGQVRITLVRTLGLLIFPLVFLEVYLLCSGFMAILSGGRFSAVTMARTFAITLVPIAIAYHIAHYLSFLLIEAQRLIPLVSDPFGFGWNLLGTATYRSHSGIVDAWFGWYTAVITIVVGHVIAMYLAYLLALRLLHHLSLAQRSQYPMLVLLVSYTVLSLWSLGQPLVESDARVHPTLNAAAAARVMDVKLSATASSPCNSTRWMPLPTPSWAPALRSAPSA